MNNKVTILENFIDKEICNILSEYFRKTVTYNEHSTSLFPGKGLTLLNEETGEIAYLDKDMLVLQGFNNEFIETLDKIKKQSEIIFSKELYLVHGGYHLMAPGSTNNTHIDRYNIVIDDNINYTVSHSALLYLNSQGIDYSGGEICFPEHNLSLQPQAGTVLIFSADEPHSVNYVKSGLRDVVILFFLNKDDIIN